MCFPGSMVFFFSLVGESRMYNNACMISRVFSSIILLLHLLCYLRINLILNINFKALKRFNTAF